MIELAKLLMRIKSIDSSISVGDGLYQGAPFDSINYKWFQLIIF